MNPLRYRGYVYDHETGLYYLESRYYNPKIGRFLNADIFASTGQGFVGNNMFAYCGNNPVVRVEVEGCLYDTIFDAFSVAVSLWEVICNPSSGEAWLALGLDAACLVLPFVTGGGTAARIFSKADEVVDTAKMVSKVDDIGEIATKGSSNAIGKMGEQLAGIDQNAKVKIQINGRTRIPDALTSTELIEVKNVKYISNTQ